MSAQPLDQTVSLANIKSAVFSASKDIDQIFLFHWEFRSSRSERDVLTVTCLPAGRDDGAISMMVKINPYLFIINLNAYLLQGAWLE